MQKELFVVDSIPLIENCYLNLLLEKDMNLRELFECYIQIYIKIDSDKKYQKTQKLRFVIKDKIISFDTVMRTVLNLLKETIKTIEALNSGINFFSSFYLEVPGLDNTPVIIRKELKKSIENITEYKLEPYIIKLYTILTSYKGTDTLQQRKYKKMIENQEYMMRYKGEF